MERNYVTVTLCIRLIHARPETPVLDKSEQYQGQDCRGSPVAEGVP